MTVETRKNVFSRWRKVEIDGDDWTWTDKASGIAEWSDWHCQCWTDCTCISSICTCMPMCVMCMCIALLYLCLSVCAQRLVGTKQCSAEQFVSANLSSNVHKNRHSHVLPCQLLLTYLIN